MGCMLKHMTLIVDDYGTTCADTRERGTACAWTLTRHENTDNCALEQKGRSLMTGSSNVGVDDDELRGRDGTRVV